MTPVLIAFGSNMGDSPRQIRLARSKLEAFLTFDAESPWYETAPMYEEDQPAFLNGMWRFSTHLGPKEILTRLKLIEREMGRQSTVPNAPRPIDLDLIVYGHLCYRFTESGRVVLELPHPRAHERRFVLQPWHDLAPDAMIPGTNRTVAGSLAVVQAQTVDLYVENAKSCR